MGNREARGCESIYNGGEKLKEGDAGSQGLTVRIAQCKKPLGLHMEIGPFERGQGRGEASISNLVHHPVWARKIERGNGGVNLGSYGLEWKARTLEF